MAATTPTTRPGLRLQDGERLLLEGGPVPVLTPATIVGTALPLLLMVVGIPFLPLVPWAVRRSMGWHRWWLTDRRLVVRTGFIGWKLRSVPLDRIVDVTTKASWWDRIWGVQHIVVRDMTGETSDNGMSKGLNLLGVADAATVADRILSEAPRTFGEDPEMGEVVGLLRQLVAQGA